MKENNSEASSFLSVVSVATVTSISLGYIILKSGFSHSKKGATESIIRGDSTTKETAEEIPRDLKEIGVLRGSLRSSSLSSMSVSSEPEITSDSLNRKLERENADLRFKLQQFEKKIKVSESRLGAESEKYVIMENKFMQLLQMQRNEFELKEKEMRMEVERMAKETEEKLNAEKSFKEAIDVSVKVQQLEVTRKQLEKDKRNVEMQMKDLQLQQIELNQTMAKMEGEGEKLERAKIMFEEQMTKFRLDVERFKTEVAEFREQKAVFEQRKQTENVDRNRSAMNQLLEAVDVFSLAASFVL